MIEIISETGSQVYSRYFDNIQTEAVKIDISKLKTGIYILRIKDKNKIESGKI